MSLSRLLPFRRFQTGFSKDSPSSPDILPQGLPNPSVLRQLTDADRWGSIDVRPGFPEMDVFEDVYLVPDCPGGHWGVFDHNDEPIRASLDFSHPSNNPMRPTPISPVRYSEISASLPEDVYLYFGFVHGHFGHFIADSLSRAWPLLDEATTSGARILFHGERTPERWWLDEPWKVQMLNGLGLTRERFVDVVQPVRVSRLLIPQRSFQGETFVYDAHRSVCLRIGDSLVPESPKTDYTNPIYYSKSQLNGGVRRITNEHQLEVFLRSRGVEVLYPEQMTLKAQVDSFSSSRTVIGTAGSAFHVNLFARAGAKQLIVELMERVNSNYFNFDRISGHNTSYWQALGSSRREAKGTGWMVEDSYRDPVAVGRELLKLL